jgi:hypothetical protein
MSTCEIEFDGNPILVDAMFDPSRPKTGKSIGDYIVSTMNTIKTIGSVLNSGVVTNLLGQ